jgi:hypothetical protein
MGMETIFDCEPSGLRKNLPPHLKAPLPIASERSKGLLSDLQNRGAIVFCDRFFDVNGNQVQDMQVAPDPFPATVLMVNAMNTNAALTDLLRQGDIPRLLNQELKNRKPEQKNDDNRSNLDSSFSLRIESRKTAESSSSAGLEPRKPRDPVTPSDTPTPLGTNRGEKRKEESNDTPSPSLELATGLCPMLNGDVLHPFEPQNYRWDDLWLEQDQGKALREFIQKLLRNELSEVDKAAVREVCAFFMNLKKNTRLFQQRVDWKSPNARIRSVMDQGARADAAIVSSTQMRKGSKQQRRSSAGIGRDASDSLSLLMIEWNVDAPSILLGLERQPKGSSVKRSKAVDQAFPEEQTSFR